MEPSELPQPPITGSSGTQEPATAQEVVVLKADPPLAGLPLAETVQGLAATRARSFGGEIGAQLVAGSFTHISLELQSTKQELRDVQRELKKSNADLAGEQMKNATLQERLVGLSRSKHFGQAGVLIGTIVLGVGFDMVRGTQQMLGLGLSLLGVILILVSWFASPKGSV